MEPKPELIRAGKYADIHKTDSPAREGETMSDEPVIERRNTSFFAWVNLRLAVIQAVIVAVVGIGSVYTASALSQQALANKVENLETIVTERQKTRDDQIAEIKATVKTDVVSKEILDLKLKPIIDEQKAQRELLEQIRTTLIQMRTDRPPSSP